MNTQKTFIIALSTLVIGLIIGWLLFGKQSEPAHNEKSIEHSAHAEEEWTCAMHPQIRTQEFGTCPICGMDLTPVTTNTQASDQLVQMSDRAMKLANIQTEIVSESIPNKSIDLFGRVSTDESKVINQTSHFSGRVEKLLVNTTGEFIQKGQIIAYIYSPALVTAQEELFVALTKAEAFPQLLEAAKTKLKNWMLSEKQIEGIIAHGTPQRQFPILADRSGVVLQKLVNRGDHIYSGSVLFEISDLTRLWVLLDIYESDMEWLQKGQKVNFTVKALSGKQFDGVVDFIDPVINPQTRVAQARVLVSNDQLLLKPQMLVTATIQSALSNTKASIIVPQSAVLWTGKRSLVYVKSTKHKGHFERRNVTLGQDLGDEVQILTGLKVGDEIAVNGTFTIDAAAQLAGKNSMMNREDDSNGSINPLLSADAKKALTSLYTNYLSIKTALANDQLEETIQAAKTLNQTISNLNLKDFNQAALTKKWADIFKELATASQGINTASKLETAREHFLSLSNQMILLSKNYQPFEQPLFIQHCPMADRNNGADWLSLEKEIINPYFGASMLKCGEIKEVL